MSNATASLCPPGNQMTDISSLPIPTGITVVVISGSNITDHAMVACCAPKPINIAAGCYEWSEIADAKVDNFTMCLQLNGQDNQSTITGFRHRNGAGKTTMTIAQIGL